MIDRYAIRSDYRARSEAQTLDPGEARRYWTEERLARSGEWQYDVYRLARDLARERGAKSVLDVGSGPGTKAAALLRPVCPDVTLLDQPTTREIAERVAPGARFVAADLAEIDLDLGRRFDLVVCADVLEHLLDPDPCAELVRAHLAPEGLAVFSTPDRDHLYGPECLESPHPEHVREWTGAEFRAYLGSRGFEVERQDWLPLRRLPALDFALGRRLWRHTGRAGRRRWAACQVAVCRAR